MSRHTPGEWRAIRDENGIISEIAGPCREHRSCRKTVVFRVTHDLPDWMSKPQSEHVKACCCEGNFRLWAAAPQLLEALKELIPIVHPSAFPEHVRLCANEGCACNSCKVARAEQVVSLAERGAE